jgi:hypothetical protein
MTVRIAPFPSEMRCAQRRYVARELGLRCGSPEMTVSSRTIARGYSHCAVRRLAI